MTDVVQNQIHAECSPSSVSRRLACPGSRRIQRLYPSPSSVYAEEGSLLHKVVEAKLRYKFYDKLSVGSQTSKASARSLWESLYEQLSREQRLVTEECFDYFMQIYSRRLLTDGELTVKVEASTSLAYAGLPEVSGTADAIIMSAKNVDVFDWKFGRGVWVDPERNVQAMSYASGSVLLSPSSPLKIHTHIVQPRLDCYNSCTYSSTELYNWVYIDLTRGIQATRDPEAPCIPGREQCRWCAGTNCEGYVRSVFNMLDDVMSVLDHINSGETTMTDFLNDHESVAQLLEKAKDVEQFIKTVKLGISNRLSAGKAYPGFKMVEGRSSRVWKNEKKALLGLASLASALGIDFEQFVDTKVLSVAQAEKVHKSLKKNESFQKLWTKKPGSPTLVTEDDVRPAIQPNDPRSAFAEVMKLAKA